MSLIRTPAIVIKSIKWAETSKIVSLYSKENGRIEVIAKGVRRAKNRHSGLFESLNLIDAIIYISSKRELQNIGDSTLIKGYNLIRSDLDRTAFAFAILEGAGVGVTPGIDFGKNAEGYIRFCYANSMENIREAMDRIESFLKKYERG